MHTNLPGNSLQPSQLRPTTPCITVRQVRVVVIVMVVINAFFLSPPYPSKIKPQKVNYNLQPPQRWLCVNTLSSLNSQKKSKHTKILKDVQFVCSG
jgi:hypothetical protein